MQMTVNLKPKEIEEIIKKYVEEKTGHQFKSISAKVSKGYDDGPMGYTGPSFDGYDVVVETK